MGESAGERGRLAWNIGCIIYIPTDNKSVDSNCTNDTCYERLKVDVLSFRKKEIIRVPCISLAFPYNFRQYYRQHSYSQNSKCMNDTCFERFN